jgi:hypothetical protein
VDADIASALLLEIPNEFDQPAVEHRRSCPILPSIRTIALVYAGTASRLPTRYQVSISPLPLINTVPRGSHTNSSFSSS